MCDVRLSIMLSKAFLNYSACSEVISFNQNRLHGLIGDDLLSNLQIISQNSNTASLSLI